MPWTALSIRLSGLPGEEGLAMRLRLVSGVAALIACSAVQANCSREPGGDAVRTLDGVKCLGGCEPATPVHCERVVVE